MSDVSYPEIQTYRQNVLDPGKLEMRFDVYQAFVIKLSAMCNLPHP